MTRICGLGAAPGSVEGVAYVLVGEGIPSDVPERAVIVVKVLHPYLAPLLSRAVGIVVETGGLLQHAVILAREFGIPAIVGVTDATRQIATGTRLRVDGAVGSVVEVDQK